MCIRDRLWLVVALDFLVMNQLINPGLGEKVCRNSLVFILSARFLNAVSLHHAFESILGKAEGSSFDAERSSKTFHNLQNLYYQFSKKDSYAVDFQEPNTRITGQGFLNAQNFLMSANNRFSDERMDDLLLFVFLCCPTYVIKHLKDQQSPGNTQNLLQTILEILYAANLYAALFFSSNKCLFYNMILSILQSVTL
eukprot:TRINITY_DN5897_c0_g1_i4.p1 TRINITY_DN5897_c0_g1~~TRINITY_DN5897_c0_g1_i4.p1  ORF type:complete len:226 (+),score=45.73 TRINITY_DN5897_c0_g1_i4:91-678(+)